MKIMTLNVNGFRGADGNLKNVPDICLEHMKRTKELIDKLVINKNDIIVLQEVPHKIKPRDWFYNLLHNRFNEMFQEYKILKPKHLIDSLQCTVAICKKDSSWEQLAKDVLQYEPDYSYGNKFVELQCGDVTLLGVHVPTVNKMWDLLLQALKDAPYTCVVGDFNANEKRGEMADKPEKIRDCGYNHLIPYNVITCYSHQTSIDNIYFHSSLTMDKNFSVKVVNTNLTDHALCIFEYELQSLS